jgi:hypothetical protein
MAKQPGHHKMTGLTVIAAFIREYLNGHEEAPFPSSFRKPDRTIVASGRATPPSQPKNESTGANPVYPRAELLGSNS